MDETRNVILLVQEDKRYLETVEPEAQLIAEAIAMFQDHNHRLRAAGLAPLQSCVVPGISMMFHAIERGQYPPPQVTTVHCFVPPVPRSRGKV